MIEVILEPWEMEFSKYVAQRRDAVNRMRPNSREYQDDMLQDNAIAETAACRCELAVAKYLNRYWAGGWWDTEDHHLHADEADIFPDIEVKRIRNINNRMPVKRKYVELGQTIVLTYIADNSNVVNILGKKRAADAWALGIQPDWDSTGNLRLMDKEHLEPL